MSDWIAAFQSVVFKDDCSRHTIEEDNDLYCSSGEGECFILASNILISSSLQTCVLFFSVDQTYAESYFLFLMNECLYYMLYISLKDFLSNSHLFSVPSTSFVCTVLFYCLLHEY